MIYQTILAASSIELSGTVVAAIVTAVIGGFGACGSAIWIVWKMHIKGHRNLAHRADHCDKDRARLQKWSSQQDVRIARLDGKIKILESCSHPGCPFKAPARRVREDIKYLNPESPTEPIPPYGQDYPKIA